MRKSFDVAREQSCESFSREITSIACLRDRDRGGIHLPEVSAWSYVQLVSEVLMFRPTFVDHLVFRVSDMDRTIRFYSSLLGEPYRAEDYVMYRAGDTLLFFTRSVHAQAFNKENVGLNHIALGVRKIDELRMVEAQLNQAAIVHSGIKLWQDGLTQYIWLDDPDGIRLEYWLRLPENEIPEAR